jgi:hypothetical protein
VAVVVFVLAGCGDGSNATRKKEEAAAVRWAGGLRHWGSGMTRAINGISVLFSQPAAVRGIQAGDRRVEQELARYERTLAACSAQVERLGTPPVTLVLPQHEALHACKSLERAAALIRSGVSDVQRGLGYDVLNATDEPLSAGEDGVRRAQLDLVQG